MADFEAAIPVVEAASKELMAQGHSLVEVGEAFVAFGTSLLHAEHGYEGCAVLLQRLAAECREAGAEGRDQVLH